MLRRLLMMLFFAAVAHPWRSIAVTVHGDRPVTTIIKDRPGQSVIAIR